MTPEQFNALVAKLVNGLRGAPDIDSVEQGEFADNDGTEPVVYVSVAGVDLALTVDPM
jgi:hypothetical protein